MIKTLWLKNEFKRSGLNMRMRFPIYLIGGKYITIGNNFYTGPRLRIEAWDKYGIENYTPELIIGNNVSFNFNCHIGCINKIVIGNNVMVGSNVLITDHSHGKGTKEELDIPAGQRTLFSKGEVIIEENVWLGENVSVLSDVIIGKNSIIGCNSVVTKNIPPNVIAAGNPAKILKNLI
jgi:acetyltransferase-like isoleucine patch superfamily enzyme